MKKLAKYTIELKTLMEDPEAKKALNKAMSTYPLYKKKSKEEYCPSIIPTRDELNSKILNYYKYREIAFETPGRFLDELEIALVEIMPYYNQLFFSADQDYNIKFNVDYLRETTRKKEDTSENTSNETGENSTDVLETSSANSNSNGKNTSSASDESTTTANVNHHNKSVNSKTPQGLLDIPATGVDSISYADEVNFSHDVNSDSGSSQGSSSSESTSELSGTTENEMSNNTKTNTKNNVTSNGKNNENEESTERVAGNYGMTSTQSLIRQYRDLIINIEQQIIRDRRIAELFMMIW